MPQLKPYRAKYCLVLLIGLIILVLPGGCSPAETPLEETFSDEAGQGTMEGPVVEESSETRPTGDEIAEDDSPGESGLPEAPAPENSNHEQAGQGVAQEDSHRSPLLMISDGDYLLALVTKGTVLRSDYSPADLVSIPAYMKPSYSMQLRLEAYRYLEVLWQAAAEEAVVLHIRSAYRSYNTQQGLFQDYARRHGEVEANRFSARAGQSEHQLGTTVDFGGTAVDFQAAYGQTEQGIWLAENAHRFGFAMSYPQGKEAITGYIYEPWHYRYIGLEAALEWYQSGLTLNQFLEGKPQFYE